jgi:hypothetical protein
LDNQSKKSSNNNNTSSDNDDDEDEEFVFLTDLIPGSNTLREPDEDESEKSSMQEEHEQITINDNYEQGANLETLKEDSNDDC